MTLPICIEIEPLGDPLRLAMPGGGQLEHINLMDLAQPALAPLFPLFDIVDAIVAAYRCIQAIPDALSMPPDPTVVASRLPELSKKVGQLLGLVPQLSLPRTAQDLVRIIISALRDARAELDHLRQQTERIARVVGRATELDDDGLRAIAGCAEGNVQREARNVGARLASAGRLLGILGVFMEMTGGPAVPDLSNVAGRGLDQVIEPLDAVLAALEGVAGAISVP